MSLSVASNPFIQFTNPFTQFTFWYGSTFTSSKLAKSDKVITTHSWCHVSHGTITPCHGEGLLSSIIALVGTTCGLYVREWAVWARLVVGRWIGC